MGENEYRKLADGLRKDPSLSEKVRAYSSRHSEISHGKLQDLRDKVNDIDELIDQSGLSPVIEFVANLMLFGPK